jgi:formylglycine-generating enzyme required for sulfatase activity
MNKNFSFFIKGIAIEMVYVEGGSFQMGETIEQLDNSFNEFFDKLAVMNGAKPERRSQKVKRDERALPHLVSLDDFFIAQTVVTQQLWDALMWDNPSEFKGPRRPVECVSWFDCHKFIAKLNAWTKQQFRLPTEAEWEYAARGGTGSQGCKYAGSNTIDDVAWYWGNSKILGISNPEYGTHAVGTKAPNELGLYDMTGNVMEWCQDWYDSYDSSAQTNPTGPSSGSIRVLRGGSWINDAGSCRVAFRSGESLSDRSNYIGLRLAF